MGHIRSWLYPTPNGWKARPGGSAQVQHAPRRRPLATQRASSGPGPTRRPGIADAVRVRSLFHRGEEPTHAQTGGSLTGTAAGHQPENDAKPGHHRLKHLPRHLSPAEPVQRDKAAHRQRLLRFRVQPESLDFAVVDGFVQVEADPWPSFARPSRPAGLIEGASGARFAVAFSLWRPLVGATGFEPAASWSQTKCSTRLSYAPNHRPFIIPKKSLHAIQFSRPARLGVI